MKKLTLAHLYPDIMNIYGDWGNILTLRKRLEWRGYGLEYHAVHAGEPYDFTQADIVFGGGGQDNGQFTVADDLQKRKKTLQAMNHDGVVFLLVCGLYQLFGNRFITYQQEEIAGTEIFDAETVGSEKRLIGNVVIQSRWSELVGFENHSGQTTLAPGQSALGRVRKGHGNNGDDGFEGAITNNAFGTYLHGSLLPKNPVFADELLRRALQRKYGSAELSPLDGELAQKAVSIAKQRPQ